LDENRKYVTFKVWDRIRPDVEEAINGDYRTICWIFPRRHGKTLISALYICWRFTVFQNEDIGIVAQSEKQSVDTAFRLVRDCLTHTPAFGRFNITVNRDRIEYGALGNVIQGYANNPTTLLGKSMTVAQCSELHKARNTETFSTLKGNLMDTRNGVLLVDSTPGSKVGPLGLIYESWQACDDESLFVSHVSYTDVDDAVKNSPPWVNTGDLRILQRTMLPGHFRAEHLGQFSDGDDMLFPEEVISRCRDVYPLDVQKLANGRPVVVGGGLDRAKPFSIYGKDSTCTACVAMLQIDEDTHYYVMDQRDIRFSRGDGIKAAFVEYAKTFGMKHLCIEDANTSDIIEWANQQVGFDCEGVSPTPGRQSTVFTEMYLAASEGRLHIHPKFDKIFREMATFTVNSDREMPKFEHAPGKHDDSLYALGWAIYSLREQVLPAYSVGGINCTERSPAVKFCVLNGGTFQPHCAEDCRSFQRIWRLYDLYKDKSGCAPMKFEDFFKYKVVNTGPHSMPR
jgi:hypothetical protein